MSTTDWEAPSLDSATTIGAGGYRRGSAKEIAARALTDGVDDRYELARLLKEQYPSKSKNWSVTVSTVNAEMIDRGYKVESPYRLIPPGRKIRGGFVRHEGLAKMLREAHMKDAYDHAKAIIEALGPLLDEE